MEIEKIEAELSEPGCDRCSRRGWKSILSCEVRESGNCMYLDQPEVEIQQGEVRAMARALYDTSSLSWLVYLDNFGIVTKMRFIQIEDKVNQLKLSGKLSIPPSISAIPVYFGNTSDERAGDIILYSLIAMLADGLIHVVHLVKVERNERSFFGRVRGKTETSPICCLLKTSPDFQPEYLGVLERKILRKLPLYPPISELEPARDDIFSVVRYIFDDSETENPPQFLMEKITKENSWDTRLYEPDSREVIDPQKEIVEKAVANLTELDPELVQTMRNAIMSAISTSRINIHVEYQHHF